MDNPDIARDIASLPSDVQKQVADFVAFMKTRYPVALEVPKSKDTNLTDNPSSVCGATVMI